MKTQFTLFLFLTLTCYTISYSQPRSKTCYIINNQSDTIFGTGYVSKGQEYCMFKENGFGEHMKILPDDIKAFRVIGGKYFISRQITEYNGKTKWYFLEFLVDGEIDLFAITKSGRFFIDKENEKFMELNDNLKNITKIDGGNYLKKDKRYVGLIKLYMTDAPQLYKEIDKIENLQQLDLVKLSVEYHKAVCTEHECMNYTKNVPKVTYKIEVLTGYNHHNKDYTPQYGLLVHVWRPLHNERLYIKTGIMYSAKNYGRNELNYTQQNAYNIKIPVSFQYVFEKKAFKPALAIGFTTGIYPIVSLQGGFIYSITDKFEFSFSSSLDGLLSIALGMHKDLYNNELGHSENIGLSYNFK